MSATMLSITFSQCISDRFGRSDPFSMANQTGKTISGCSEVLNIISVVIQLSDFGNFFLSIKIIRQGKVLGY